MAVVPESALGARFSEYIWLSRGEQSHLFPIVARVLNALEGVASTVPPELVSRRRREQYGNLVLTTLKFGLYSALQFKQRHEKYKTKLRGARQNCRDVDIMIAAEMLPRGDMSALLDRYGSDKAGKRNYTLLYEALLNDRRNQVTRVFEMGVFTGASLRAWRDFFPNAMIIGGDIDERLLFEEERVRTVAVDQSRPESVTKVFDALGGVFDVILDDGWHTVGASRSFFESAFDRVSPGGYFIIEDIVPTRRDAYEAFTVDHDTLFIDIPNARNRYDNCVVVVAKP